MDCPNPYFELNIYIDKNVNESTTVCLLRSLRSLALNYASVHKIIMIEDNNDNNNYS